MKENSKIIVCACIISLAFIVSASLICLGLFNVTAPERTVSVRGLSEREYDADFAVWPIKFTIAGNDLQFVQADISSKIDIVTSFLKDFDFTDAEITVKEPSVQDALANYYSQNDVQYRYLADVTIFVRSENIQKIQDALSESLSLIGQGIVLKNEYDSEVQFLFTKLNDIKPEMIAEATEDARRAAEKFAIDSGSSVGKIVNATQGLFSIEDASPGLSEKKTVRVVTTVEYLLND